MHFFFSELFVQLIYLFFIGWFFLMSTFQVLYRFQLFIPSRRSSRLPWSRLSLQSADCFLFNYMKSVCQPLKLFPDLLEFLSSSLKMIPLGEVQIWGAVLESIEINEFYLCTCFDCGTDSSVLFGLLRCLFSCLGVELWQETQTSHWALTALQPLRGISIPRTEPLDFCFPPLVWSSVTLRSHFSWVCGHAPYTLRGVCFLPPSVGEK